MTPQQSARVWLAIVPCLALTNISCVDGTNPAIPGVKGPDLEIIDDYMLLSMVIENLHFEGGISLPIPNHPNSSFFVGPDFNSEGTLVQLTVALTDILDGDNSGYQRMRLPGGRPLPGVPGGELPGVMLTVPKLLNSVLYVGPEALGIFVPVQAIAPFNGIVMSKFYNKTGTRVGNIAIVGGDVNKAHSGLFVLISVNKQVRAALSRML